MPRSRFEPTLAIAWLNTRALPVAKDWEEVLRLAERETAVFLQPKVYTLRSDIEFYEFKDVALVGFGATLLSPRGTFIRLEDAALVGMTLVNVPVTVHEGHNIMSGLRFVLDNFTPYELIHVMAQRPSIARATVSQCFGPENVFGVRAVYDGAMVTVVGCQMGGYEALNGAKLAVAGSLPIQ